MTIRKLASLLALKEGKKKQARVGDVTKRDNGAQGA